MKINLQYWFNTIILITLALSAYTSICFTNIIKVYASDIPSLSVQAKSSILLEPSTGKILYEDNADERLAPASVTKVMTILLIYEAIASGNIKWGDTVTVSEHAAGMGGSQVFLEPLEQQPVRDLVKSIVIASANDAAVAMAEYIGGSEEGFVDLMNKKAKELGCENTNFKNACGLDEEGHYTSARDMAEITREIIQKYPEVFEFTTIWQDAITHKTKRGEEEFGLTNTNKLIKWYNGATGLKTGSTGKALYCLVGTAERNGMQLISVVLGAPTPALRFQEVMKMLDHGYTNYKAAEGLEAGSQVGVVKIGKGSINETNAVIKDKIKTIIPKSESGELEPIVTLSENLNAPVTAGTKVGEIVYFYGGEEAGRSDVIIIEDIFRASFRNMVQKLGDLWFK